MPKIYRHRNINMASVHIGENCLNRDQLNSLYHPRNSLWDDIFGQSGGRPHCPKWSPPVEMIFRTGHNVNMTVEDISTVVRLVSHSKTMLPGWKSPAHSAHSLASALKGINIFVSKYYCIYRESNRHHGIRQTSCMLSEYRAARPPSAF